MKIQRSYLQISTSLIIGLIIGSFGFGSASAEESPAPTQQGQVLNICVDKKTSTLRAVKRCKATERAVLLGGTGPQGHQGQKGDIGAQGESGAVGGTGATGSSGRDGTNGAVGAQGLQGERGLTGAQGNQGFTGATGATGSLRTKSITVWEQGYSSFCGSYGAFYALNGNTSLSQYGSTISLNKSCSSLYPSSVTVYAP